ncbi:hypothetical protein PR048_010747 [Dryococelus australis]|uniref:DUF4371 domain-containing protein n=1 Tax=Dryococelus australis TaxID=614101 RepID=A0ABQ9I413_9NEOP|nr:hypothetical protein PR048_010747 [Dryococelus australis]
MHEESTEKCILLQQTPVVNQLNKTLSEQQQQQNHVALRAIFTTAKYLAHQGVAFRSHDDISGNFDQLFNLRTNDIHELQHFLKNKKNFASWEIQNDVINYMAHSILRGLSEIRYNKEFNIIVDETRDESCKEQMSIFIRTNKHFWVYMKHPISQERDCLLLLKMMFVVLISQFKISEDNVMMAGATCVALSKEFRKDCMQWVQEIDNIVKGSPKTKKFADLAADLDVKETHDPKPLCPTRWTVRVKSITNVINSYPVIPQFLQSLAERCCNTVLQKKTMTVAGASYSINVVLECVRGKRNGDGFNHLWSAMDSKVVEYELILPTLPRSKKTSAVELQITLLHPQKSCTGKCASKHLTLLLERIQRRSEQTGYKEYAYLEDALATKPVEWNSKAIETLQEKYFDLQQLVHQIQMLNKLSPHCTKTMEYVQRLRDMHLETRSIFSGVGKISLLSSGHTYHICNSLTFFLHASNPEKLPANDNDTEETEFIVYGKLNDNLNINKPISEFINVNEYRVRVFGKNN